MHLKLTLRCSTPASAERTDGAVHGTGQKSAAGPETLYRHLRKHNLVGPPCLERLYIVCGEDFQQYERSATVSRGTSNDGPIRTMPDDALKDVSRRFGALYGEDGRRSVPLSVPPERAWCGKTMI